MKHHSSFLLLALAGLILSCKSSSVATGPNENSTTGSISGSVSVRNNQCNSIADASGVTVYLEAIPSGIVDSAVSNFEGQWSLKHVPAGYYHIRISKPGFQTYVSGSTITTVGAGDLPFDQLYGGLFTVQNSNYGATIDTPTFIPQDKYQYIQFLIGHLDSTGQSVSIYQGKEYLFVGKNQNVDPSDTATYQYADGGSEDGGLSVYSLSLYNVGFNPGDTAFAVAAILPNCNLSPFSVWTSRTTVKYAYTGFGSQHSKPMRFIVP